MATSDGLSDAYYFGCRHGPGHFLHSVDKSRRDSYDDMAKFAKLFVCHIDGGFNPQIHPKDQGAAALYYIDGWTVLSIDNYTIDSRPNSHATFLLRGNGTFDEAVAEAQRLFPQDMAHVTNIHEVPARTPGKKRNR